MFELENVALTYSAETGPDTETLSDINLSFRQGERWAIIGPSGCGKSSLLLLLAGLLAPTSGRILFNGLPVRGPQQEVSLILQDYGLFPWKTVLENALLGLILKNSPLPESKDKVFKILDSLGLSQHWNKYPSQLSGGQRQRVAIARALALESKCLLMDEPFSALDALTREQLQAAVLALWKELNFTMILVTHSIEEAVFLGNNIVVLSPAPGRVIHIMSHSNSKEGLSRDSSEFYRRCSLVRSWLEGGEHVQ